MPKETMDKWLESALNELGGKGTITEVAKKVWAQHENDIKETEELFFNWQYNLRWACARLRKAGIIKPEKISGKGIWELA